jgi:sulfur carrier protein ThiS
VTQVADDATIEDLVAEPGAEHEVYAAAVNGKAVALHAARARRSRLLFDHLHGG